jgi:hypothetical protein
MNETFMYIGIVAIVLICIYILINNDTNEYMITIPLLERDKPQWTRRVSCSSILDDTVTKVFDNTHLTKTSDTTQETADLIIPCSYNNINNEISILPIIREHNIKQGEYQPKRVLIIDGADEITAKNHLWKHILNYHGLIKAKELSPNTYLITGPQYEIDMKRLTRDHVPGRLYILKKNIQRQKGLKITDNIDYIKNNPDDYVIAQELLQDPYIINNRKINLRVYILVVCNKDKTDVYMFNDGFMYYTKKNFLKGSHDEENHITTGYVDRDVYVKNPLTHSDFKTYLDMNEGSKYHPENAPKKLNTTERILRDQGFKLSDVVFKQIEKLMTDVMSSFKGHICRHFNDKGDSVPIYDDYSVQIFGADVAINDKLKPQIIEINKGPDLSSKDDRDGMVKRKMFGDVLEIIGIKSINHDNGLIHILEM